MQYQVIYSDRKTLSMEIKNGQITVRAPRRCPEKRISDFVHRYSKWAEKKLEELSKKPPSPMSRELSPCELEALKQYAKKLILPRAHELSARSGLLAKSFSITSARTRFGSCSAKNTVNFSCFLALYKPQYIDYVIFHELCHTVYKNHSKDFYGLIEKHVPNYKELQSRLKKGDPECFAPIDPLK